MNGRSVAVGGFSRADIQGAIDSLPAGGTVHLPRGTYHLDRTLTVSSNIAIVGDGPRSTHIVLARRTSQHMIVNRHPDGDERIELRGFSLDGDMTNQPPPFADARAFAFGVFFRNVRGVVIDAIEARRIRQTAVQLNRCSDVTVTDVEASELGCGALATSGTTDIDIRRLAVTDAALVAKHSAIHLGGCTGGYVEASVDGCSSNGILLDAVTAPLGNIVVRGVGRRCQRGVSVAGGGAHPVGNVFLTGEYSGNRECGVMVSNATNVFIIGAAVTANGEQGVVLQGRAGARHCVIADCRITGNPVAVDERDGSRDNYRVGNSTD